MKLIKPLAVPSADGALTRSTASDTYVDIDGTVKTCSGANEPRYNRGALLIEAAGTNELLKSSRIDAGATWLTIDTSITTGSATGARPDGTSGTYYYLGEAAATRQFGAYQRMTRAGAFKALTMVVKSSGCDRFRVALCDEADYTKGFGADVNLTAGTVTAVNLAGGGGTATSATAFIETLRDGWVRVGISGNFTALPTNYDFVIWLADSSGSVASHAGDTNRKLAIWHMQLEALAAATDMASSIIVTDTVAVTRGADTYTAGLLSNVAEPASGESAYNAGTTYAADALVVYTTDHKVYRSLQSGNTGNTPSSRPAWWYEVSGSRRWAAFDTANDSASYIATRLQFSFPTTKAITSVALMGVEATSVTVTLLDEVGGDVVYTETFTMSSEPADVWYAYNSAGALVPRNIVATSLPEHTSGIISVVIDATGGTAKVAACLVGTAFDLGISQTGAGGGIRDYSRKSTDDISGVTTLTEGRWSKRSDIKMWVEAADSDGVYAVLTAMRAQLGAWVGDDTGARRSLCIYGWLRDWSLDVAYATGHWYSLQIEGIV